MNHNLTQLQLCHFNVVLLIESVQDLFDISSNVDGGVLLGRLDEGLRQEALVLGPLLLVLDQADVDKIDKVESEGGITPLHLGLQPGRVRVHHLLELVEHRVPLGIRKPEKQGKVSALNL